MVGKIEEIFFQVQFTVRFKIFYLFFEEEKNAFYFLVKNLPKNRKRGKIIIFLGGGHKEKIEGIQKKILKSLLAAVLISASVERFGVA